MILRRTVAIAVFAAFAAASGCSDDVSFSTDSKPSSHDSTAGRADNRAPDSGGAADTLEADSGAPGEDAATSLDAGGADGKASADGAAREDAAAAKDSGALDQATVADGPQSADSTPAADSTQAADAAPTPDQAQSPSARLRALRGMANGVADFAVSEVYVTYVREALGDDAAGFFVQAETQGPAVFVAVDPATLSPAPQAGDLVHFSATALVTRQAHREVSAISGWAVDSTGNDLAGLIQDLSNANDVASGIADYESELVSLTGVIAEPFVSAGPHFVSAAFVTTGIPSATDMKLRLPTTIQKAIGLIEGCTFVLKGTPLWRFNSQAQPSAWVATDIELKQCGLPKLVSAVATSETTVTLKFDQPIDPNSLHASGDQFTFDPALSASAANVSGEEVVVTTSAQTSGTAYTVTVATSLKDTNSAPLDGQNNTASFSGFSVAAKVVLNEVNANMTNGCDLLELRVVEGGSIRGFKVFYRASEVITLPDIVAKKNDYVVVHLDASDTKCYPSVPADETLAKDEQPHTAVDSNYDTAFDVYTPKAGFGTTTGVISLRDADDNVIDALLYVDRTTAPAASTLTAGDAAAAAGQWFAPDGSAPPATYDATTFREHAAGDIRNNGSVASGKTLSRNSNADTNTKNDWTDAEDSTWGANNPGQSDL